jgi:general secretion pathway protein J
MSVKAKTAGFTLVELLLAITLMSILLGLTYSGLRAASRSTQRGEIILAAAGEMRAAHQFVRRQLNQMMPLTFAMADDASGARIVFAGNEQAIQFVSPMPGYLGSGGPQVQLLELANSENGGSVLQISHALLQTYMEGNPFDREPVVLLENIQSAGFEFMGRDEQGGLTGWMPSWEQVEVLPVAVRLSVEFSEEDVQMYWPHLVAGVRVDELASQAEVRNDTYRRKIRELISGKATSDE